MEFFDIPGMGRISSNEVRRVKRPAIEQKKVATWRRQPGHTVFSFNTKTKELKVATLVEHAAITFSRTVARQTRIYVEKDCIYVEALNRKNAVKQLRREGLV